METIDITKLVGSLKDWDTWVVIIIVSIFGMLGGLAHKLTSPPEDKTSLPGYIVVGAVASLAVLFIFFPLEPVKLIALSLAAGYGGKAVLDALEARVKTAIAQAETAKAKEEGKKAVETGKAAVKYAQTLLEKATKGLEATNLELMIGKSPDAFSDELKKLSNELDFLGESFQGK